MPQRSTVEPCIDEKLQHQTQRSIRSFKPHVHLNDCLSGHPVLISQLILSEVLLLRKRFQVKNGSSYSLVDLTTETKAQFFSQSYSSRLTEASLTRLKKTCLSSVNCMITSLFVFREVFSVSLPIVIYLTKP